MSTTTDNVVDFPGSQWPREMDEDAFYGLAGDIVHTIAPHSEADRNGLLLQLLAAIGNSIGPSPYYQVEATKHHCNLFAVIVGDTARARKGTSWQWIKRIVSLADEGWSHCQASGMSSGEGVIYQVRDDEAEHPDRRLMIVEGEFVQALKVSRREGNTLSVVLRNAWDGGTLRTLTRNSPLVSTDGHISVIGHITEDELLSFMSACDMSNGFGNRFLWACVRRSQLLPHGGKLKDSDLVPLVNRLRRTITEARRGGAVTLGEDAKGLWEAIYQRYADSTTRGLVGAMTARQEAQTARLAMLFALLDESYTIGYDHLRAAQCVADYCERSVRYIFASATGNQVADAILRALEDCPKISRTALYRMNGKHWRRGQVDEAIELLVEEYGVTRYEEPTGGRPKTWLLRQVMQ